MLNMTSLSANLSCEPPLAVFLAFKLQSHTRNQELIQIPHKYILSVSYMIVLSIESRLAHAKITQRATVCPTNLHQDIFAVAALDNLDHNQT